METEKGSKTERKKKMKKDSKREKGRKSWFRVIVAKNPDCLKAEVAYRLENQYPKLPIPRATEK